MKRWIKVRDNSDPLESIAETEAQLQTALSDHGVIRLLGECLAQEARKPRCKFERR